MGLEHENQPSTGRRRRRALVVPAALALVALGALGGVAWMRGAPGPRVASAALPEECWAPAPAPVKAPVAPAAVPPAAPFVGPVAPSSRGTIPGGALTAQATLGQAKIVRGSDGELYLHVGIDAAEEAGREHRPIDFSLVLDVSGSMAEQNKLVLLKKATRDLLAKLGPEDRVAIVAFSNDARTVFPLAPLGDAARRRAYASAVDELEAGGGTNLSAGILAGADELRRAEARPGSARRIVLMTDGFANFGVVEPAELTKLVNGLAREGATLSTIGLGLEYSEKLLSDLADAGGGAFYDADRAERLARIYDAEVAATRGLVAHDARLVLTPAPGVSVESVFIWPTTDGKEGERTLSLGDVAGGRHLKAVARLKLPTSGKADSLDVVRVSLRYDDVRGKTAERVATSSVALGVELAADEQVARASEATELKADLDKVAVADGLVRAHELTLAGNPQAARALIAQVATRNHGNALNYRAADGTDVTVNLDALTVACVTTASGELSDEANALLKRAYAAAAPLAK